jgi:TetR/AcrR family transcriptional regulator
MKKSDDSGARRRFHTETFEKIDSSRREAILSVALAEFADKGFNGTSVNGLARKAGVSIGSLYSYFPSKEDLFLTVADIGHALLEKAISDIDPAAGLFESYGAILRKARDYAKSNPELNLVYLDATTQGLRHLARRLAGSLEAITIDLYRRVIGAAIASGELRPDIDVGAAAFCLDNLVVMLQFSFSSDYHRDRLRLFLGLGEDAAIDEDALLEAMLDFARRALKAT